MSAGLAAPPGGWTASSLRTILGRVPRPEDATDVTAPVDGGRTERAQAALYRIAELASSVQDMQEFYREVHAVVGELMAANNFFIVLYDDERQLMSWPYFVDELDLDV